MRPRMYGSSDSHSFLHQHLAVGRRGRRAPPRCGNCPRSPRPAGGWRAAPAGSSWPRVVSVGSATSARSVRGDGRRRRTAARSSSGGGTCGSPSSRRSCPCRRASCTDSWLTCRHASAILILAAETIRAAAPPDRVPESTFAQARLAIDRACSPLITMSTMRCCSAWNAPIGTPNCLRVLRYSSVVSLAYLIAPTASAQSSAMAKSVDLDRSAATPRPRRRAARRRRRVRSRKATSAASMPSMVRYGVLCDAGRMLRRPGTG